MKLTKENESRIIEMAWEDRTPFEAIELQFGLNESEVIRFMRSHLSLEVLNCGAHVFLVVPPSTQKFAVQMCREGIVLLNTSIVK